MLARLCTFNQRKIDGLQFTSRKKNRGYAGAAQIRRPTERGERFDDHQQYFCSDTDRDKRMHQWSEGSVGKMSLQSLAIVGATEIGG